MIDRSTREQESPSREQVPARKDVTSRNGRRNGAIKRSLFLRNKVWGALALVLIAFLIWFVLWGGVSGGAIL